MSCGSAIPTPDISSMQPAFARPRLRKIVLLALALGMAVLQPARADMVGFANVSAGAAPQDVIRVVHEAGGVVSMAHPGLTKRDDLIPAMAAAGLDALEVRHSDHDAATEARYRALASALGLAATAGSDYHGDVGRRATTLGNVVMPSADFEVLWHAAERRRITA